MTARCCIAIALLLAGTTVAATDATESLQRYQQSFPEPLLDAGALTNVQLAERYEAAHEACFYTADPGLARDLFTTVGALQSRNLATPKQWVDTYECLLSARLTEEAAQVHAARHGDQLGDLPTFAPEPQIGAGTPSIWRVDAAEGALRREAVDLRGTRLVIVAHPNCGFSQRAVSAMTADASLRQLARAALWIAPGSGPFAWDNVRDWNSAHPDAALAYAWRERDWPMIEDWATPAFYFLRDGKVEQHIQGWPEEGRSAELRQAAAKLGKQGQSAVPGTPRSVNGNGT